MKCPVCPETDLTTTERQGVEIDCCPECRGVRLDLSDFDKIVERSVVMPAPFTTSSHATVDRDRHHHRRHNYHYHE